MQEKVEEILVALGLPRDHVADFLRSDPLHHALHHYLDLLMTADANRRQGIHRVVREVEYASHPFTDEDGHYVSYRCVVCGTRAKIRTLKRHQKKTTEVKLALQQNLPGTEE